MYLPGLAMLDDAVAVPLPCGVRRSGSLRCAEQSRFRSAGRKGCEISRSAVINTYYSRTSIEDNHAHCFSEERDAFPGQKLQFSFLSYLKLFIILKVTWKIQWDKIGVFHRCKLL